MNKKSKNDDCTLHNGVYDNNGKFKICLTCHKFDPTETKLGKFIPLEWENDK